MVFDPARTKDETVHWIRKWFHENGKNCNAIIGISGGKDSAVVAALCAEALGERRVIGVMLPNLTQTDINDSFLIVDHLRVRRHTVPITIPVASSINEISHSGIDISAQATVNLPARIRMTILYAVAQSMNGRVANTSNLSENWVGYTTRYGDSAGDFCPISKLTVTEVRAIGSALGL